MVNAPGGAQQKRSFCSFPIARHGSPLLASSWRLRWAWPEAGPAAETAQVPAYDPIQPVNRAIFGFNRVLDTAVIKPVAKSYTRWTPRPVRGGVRNLLQNLEEPVTFANDLMQFNLTRSAVSAGRFGLNSTVGVAGLFDVAKGFGWDRHASDFGQTLGRWGNAARSGVTTAAQGTRPICGTPSAPWSMAFLTPCHGVRAIP